MAVDPMTLGERRAQTAPALRACQTKYEQIVDPDGTMAPEQRALAVAAAKSAHFREMALKSAHVRRERGAQRRAALAAQKAAEAAQKAAEAAQRAAEAAARELAEIRDEPIDAQAVAR
jgi:hypothetical protein